MEIISHFVGDLKTLETCIFLNSTYLEALIHNNTVSEELTDLLSNPEVKDLVTLLTSKIELLNYYLEPLAKKAKDETYKHCHSKSMEPYAKYIIDPKEPIIGDIDDKPSFNYEELIKSNPISPIKHRKPLTYEGECPYCSAPNQFIYDNNHRGQFRCKVCSQTFSIHSTYSDEISIRCPYCTNKLFLHHERPQYNVWVCSNDKCPYYLDNLKAVKTGEREDLKVNKSTYKVRYTYRAFNFTLDDINKSKDYPITSKINLSSIRHSQWALGLVLTYYVNYGLSSRKTSQIMHEIHGIDISHQTVVNYAEAVASITECLNAHYKYDFSDTLTFDETYVKVKGKNSYVFFGSDTINKIISSYRIFDHRTAKEAIITLNESFNKYKAIPNDLTVITDGNPIYNASQLFFHMNDIDFDLHQVIGVSNKDATSKTWRPQKQAEERLNRTYKQNYYGTNGYGSIRNANVYISIWVTFYNFLRRHSSIKRIPINLEGLEEISLMPDKWLKLIDIAKSYI